MSAPEALPLTSSQSALPPSAENTQFHKYFPNVPPQEKLVDDYQCSYSKNKILRPGRLYVTAVRMCFYPSITTETVVIEWHHVANITKKTRLTVGMIDVETSAGPTYSFTAFSYGVADSAFKLLQMLWSVRSQYANVEESPSNGSFVIMESTGSGGGIHAAEGKQTASNSSTPRRSTSAQQGEGHLPAAVISETVEDGGEKVQTVASPQPQPVASNDFNATTTSEAQDQQHNTPLPTEGKAEGLNEGSPPNATPSGGVSPQGTPDHRPVGNSSSPEGDALPPSEASNQQPNITESDGEGGKKKPKSRSATPPHTILTNQKQQAQLINSPRDKKQSPTRNKEGVEGQEGQQVIDEGATAVKRSGSNRDRRNSKSVPQTSVEQAQSKTASHDILKHFPKIPKTEHVLDWFQCSYVCGVHRIGKMYITSNYVLFSSLMLAEGIAIQFNEIKKMEKQQTMLVFDGIVIITKNDKAYEFTSFINRESAFSILNQMVHTHRGLEKALKGEQCTASTSVSEDEEGEFSTRGKDGPESGERSLAVTTNFVPEVAQTPLAAPSLLSKTKKSPKRGSKNATTGSSKNATSSNFEKSQTGGEEYCETPFNTSTSSPVHPKDYPAAASLDAFSFIMTDQGTGFSTTDKLLATVTVPDTPMPPGFTLNDFFRIVWDDKTPFLRDYHELRKDSDIVMPDWEPCVGYPASNSFCGQRVVTYTCIIRAVFATACKCTEFHKYAFYNVQGVPTLMVQLSSHVPGVMYSDTFRAESLFVFTQTNEKDIPLVTFKAYGYIQFLKSVWLKKKIESTALTVEMPESYKRFAEHATDQLIENRKFLQDAKANKLKRSVTDEEIATGDRATPTRRQGSLPPGTPRVDVTGLPRAAVSGSATTAVPVTVATAPIWLQWTMRVCLILAFCFCLKAMWSVFWVSFHWDAAKAEEKDGTAICHDLLGVEYMVQQALESCLRPMALLFCALCLCGIGHLARHWV